MQVAGIPLPVPKATLREEAAKAKAEAERQAAALRVTLCAMSGSAMLPPWLSSCYLFGVRTSSSSQIFSHTNLLSFFGLTLHSRNPMALSYWHVKTS